MEPGLISLFWVPLLILILILILRLKSKIEIEKSEKWSPKNVKCPLQPAAGQVSLTPMLL